MGGKWENNFVLMSCNLLSAHNFNSKWKRGVQSLNSIRYPGAQCKAGHNANSYLEEAIMGIFSSSFKKVCW